MTTSRGHYGVLIFITIVAGLFSRQILVIPAVVGDVLWAVMMFLIIRFIFINSELKTIALLALVICYFIELSQLYQAPWINNIRENTLGALVLGRGFLWTDLIAYTLGISLSLWVANIFKSDGKQKDV
ncbi:MAG: DUF2809 domain-containing protein [Pedobacter sp.]|nr:MAG: DUF2809 domain-containing protein [Pedobacter sp.]